MATKRRRRGKRPIPISEIPVVEIINMPINVYGHYPRIRHLEDGSFLGGCSCGWLSRNRAWRNEGIDSWWKHAREVQDGH